MIKTIIDFICVWFLMAICLITSYYIIMFIGSLLKINSFIMTIIWVYMGIIYFLSIVFKKTFNRHE